VLCLYCCNITKCERKFGTHRLISLKMARVTNDFFKKHRFKYRWFPIITMLCSVLYTDAIGQVQVGLSLNVGNRQHYSTSTGFKRALAPSGSLSINQNLNLNHNWIFRSGIVGGIVGYKLNVVMIDTLGANGDVSPSLSTLFFLALQNFYLAGKSLF
jgi:hypothetical protein